MRSITRTAAEKGMPIQEAQKLSYSNATKMNLTTTPNPETEILKSQVTALQTEMKIMRQEVGKIRTLEEKVEKLETTVDNIQSSLTAIQKGQINIENGQSTTNLKLDRLMTIFSKNFPDEDEMDAEMETEGDGSTADLLETPTDSRNQSPCHTSQQTVEKLTSAPVKRRSSREKTGYQRKWC